MCSGYGKKEVLHDASFTVPRGSFVTLVGSNGAGKSTTVKTLFGFVAATGGQVLFEGNEIHKMRSSQRIRAGLGMVPEGAQVFTGLTVRENLELGGYLLSSSTKVRAALEWVWQLFPRLRERDAQQAQTLSGGERQMLAVGRALMLRPRALVLDEPSLGLSPQVLLAVFDALAQLNRAEGMTVLLIEQNVRAAFRVSDRAYLMRLGRVTEVIEHPDPAILPPELSRAFVGRTNEEKPQYHDRGSRGPSTAMVNGPSQIGEIRE